MIVNRLYHLLSRLARTLILCFVLLLSVENASAQFDGQYTQYMNNLSLVNPAAVGNGNLMNVSLFQRTQWIGMPGAPIVSMLSLDAPFNLFGKKHGVGLHILSDVFGVFNNQQVRLMYSYKQPLGKGYLNIATNLGFVNIICNGDSINIGRLSSDDGYHTANDPIIPTGRQTGIGFDMGLGVQYATNKYDVGASITHVTSPEISLGDKSVFKIQPLLQVHGGYRFSFEDNTNYFLRINALVMSDFVSWTASIAANVDIKNKFWLGAGYRFNDAFSLMAGVNVFEGFRLGYVCDIPVNQLITKTFWSHEVFVSYSFSLAKTIGKTTKSIRIL